MGLDIALGVLIFLGAIRGYFRGFLLQAIRLVGLVGSVYLADPVRGLAHPYVAPYLATIRPDLLDRMLWWASVVVCYLVAVGLASTVVNLQRRRPYGDPDISRADQSMGFVLAGVKSAVVMAFVVANLDKYAVDWAKSVPWADEQARNSMALVWERQYRPADKIWTSPPVQQFVAYVRKMGMMSGADLADPASKLLTDRVLPRVDPAAAANAAFPPRNPRLGLPPVGDGPLLPPNATEAEISERISQAVDKLIHP